MILICCLVLALSFSIASGQRYVVSMNLPDLIHGIRGQLYIDQEGDSYKFTLENFHYDGGGPGAVVYLYRRGATVNRLGGGTEIPYSSSRETFERRRYSGETVVVDIPSNINIRDYGTFTIWCRVVPSFFTRVDIPESIFDVTVAPTEPPGIVPPETYDNCEPLGSNLQVSWTLDTANDTAFVRLCGCIRSAQYMAFGISGDESVSRMLNADVVVTWLNETSSGAVDYYLSAYAQCRPGIEGGERAACPDSVQDGNDNATILRAQFQDNGRCVEYIRPMTATEIQDRDMNSESFIVWAIGPRNRNNDYAFEHFERLVQSTKIAFDRAPTNNCGALMCSAAEVCPWKEEVIDARNKNATFVAEIGQSGGIRGYEGITGNSGWGIAWYINDTIIPVLRVTRGNTYTFLVYGGRNKNETSNYHPFYLTSTNDGGRIANTGTSKAQEVVYAGFDDDDAPTAVGDLCIYEEDTSKSGDIATDCSKDFQDYFRTLREKTPCDGLTPGVLEWTPNEDTPDLLYYQCATHLFFGWKIQVESSSALVSAPLFAFLTVAAILITFINL